MKPFSYYKDNDLIEFDLDVLEDIGFLGDLRGDLIMAKAWEDSHAYGLSGVHEKAKELAQFIRDCDKVR